MSIVDYFKDTVLDTDNLHFSDEFLDFPVQADALGFSAGFRAEESIEPGIPRGFVRKTKPSRYVCT